MNEPHDPNKTVDVPSTPADSLDAGLAAGFGRPEETPRSSLDASQRPLLLHEAKGESDHIVKPNSDAMPPKSEAGDRYQLYGEIARGGMGAVLRGRDTDLGRDLAVKVLLEKYADRPEVARRFIEEAQIGGQLQHPGVVPVYDIGRFGDRPFFTMKLVKGQTLAALLAERTNGARPEIARRASKGSDPCSRGGLSGAPPDLPRFLAIALQVAQTLAYAHAKGVIHRDLKPANIMVGAFGEVQVMDWGLAKVLAGGVGQPPELAGGVGQPAGVEPTVIRTARSGTAGTGTDTEAGSLLGTPAYMPPEQANGDVALLDRRADVFGLGALLCEMLTGKPPYVGRSPEEVRRKAANGDLVDARARLDACGADAELIALTHACLSPEAIDRPKDARMVADALKAYLDGVQDRLHKATLAEAEARARATEEAKRRRLTLALAATVLLAVTLGGGGWLWVKAERDARQTQVTRDVNDAVNKATALRERAKTANTGSAALFAQAREQLQRALALVENGAADVALKEQVAQLQTELDEEEKDRQLIAALDATRLAQAETLAGENRFASERAVPKFRKALQAYGLPVGEGEPAAAATRLRERPAAVREAVSAVLDEWIVMAANPTFHVVEPHLDWLRAVAAAVEPDEEWTRKLRAALEGKNDAKQRAALEQLAREADVTKLSPRALTRLAWQLEAVQARMSAVALLRRAQRQYPADVWINQELGMISLLAKPPDLVEAVRYLTVAMSLRPDSPGAHLNLGVALETKGQLDEAVVCFRKAIELDPTYAAAHSNLGMALDTQGQPDAAVACFRKAIELDPKDAAAYTNLGVALRAKGRLDEAIACYRKAIELDPNLAKAHYDLGNALKGKGQVDEAIACYKKAVALDPKFAGGHLNLGAALYGKGQVDAAIDCYRKAIELDPKNAFAHNNLGVALAAKGRLDEAVVCYRKAIELDPTYAAAHCNLGMALGTQGQPDAAIACFHKAIEFDPKFAAAHRGLGEVLLGTGRYAEARDSFVRALELLGENHPSRGLALQQVQISERFLKLQKRLPQILRGEDKSVSAAESLDLATICQHKRMHAAAARFAADGFAADSKLADDLNAGRRYNAACFACLAAAGKEEDAARIKDKERTQLRQQALDWLRADLAAWTKRLDSDPLAARAAVRHTLRHWQKDSDLAGIRDSAALKKLPAEERAACAKLWTDVAALLKRANTPPAKETKP